MDWQTVGVEKPTVTRPAEHRQRGVECNPEGVHDTPWGTREFALYDVDRNALTFYRDLTSAEKDRLMSELDGPRSGPEGSLEGH